MILAPLLLELSGLMCLALSLRTNRLAAFGYALTPSHGIFLRCGGAVLIALSTWLWMRHYGSGIGLVTAVAHVAVAGAGISLLLSRAPRFLPSAALAALIAGILCSLLS